MTPANLRWTKGGKARSAAALADKVEHEPHAPAWPAGAFDLGTDAPASPLERPFRRFAHGARYAARYLPNPGCLIR